MFLCNLISISSHVQITDYQRYMVALAKAKNIDPCTLVINLEVTDGRERGERQLPVQDSNCSYGPGNGFS